MLLPRSVDRHETPTHQTGRDQHAQ